MGDLEQGKNTGLVFFWVLLCFQEVAVFVTPTHVQECPSVVDVVFMIDSSRSMSREQWENTKLFTRSVLSHLNPTSEGINVAVLAFSNAAYVKHSFSDKQDTSAIQKALDDVTLDIFPANTVLAFNEAQRLLSCERKQRMPRVLVVASNGQYGFPGMAATSAQILKDDGIVIISLGLSSGSPAASGSNINENRLEIIASSRRHVLVTSYPSDVSHTNELVSMICSVDRKPEGFISRLEETSSLAGHLIERVHAWDDFFCAFSCLHTKNCYSFNFKERSQDCQLNHSNKFASPDDLVMDTDSVYYELVL